MSKPWLTDPLYGGMSERAARLSYEVSLRAPPRVLANPLASDAEIARRKLIVEDLLQGYADAIKAADEWMSAYKVRRPRGFRALRR